MLTARLMEVLGRSEEAQAHAINNDPCELADQGDEPTVREILDADEAEACFLDARADGGLCPGLGTPCDYEQKAWCLCHDACALKHRRD